MGLTPSTTYFYRVAARNNIGTSSFSNVADATTMAPPVTTPAAPSTLQAQSISTTRINLTWTDNSNNETGFYVERSSNGTVYNQVAQLSAGVVTYSDNALMASSTYYYRVRAYNSAGNSTYTNDAMATTMAMPMPPTAPMNLTVAAASSTQINLAWADSSANETGFYVERSLNGTTYAQIAVLGANVSTYASSGLTASTNYHFRVRAFNEAGASNYSNSASVSTQAPPVQVPAAPSNLSLSVQSATQINLAWRDNSNNESGFYIERATAGGSYSQIASVAANITTYNSGSLTGSTSYSYRVRAHNSAGNSGYTPVATAQTQAAPVAPNAPSALSLTVASSTQINLSWMDNANNETGFYIERSADGTSFTQIAAASANATTYSSSGLTANSRYYYRVRAYNATGNSAYSNTANATTQAETVT